MKKLLIIICLLLCFSLNIHATSVINQDAVGSITIKLVDPETKEAIKDASYTFYKVANITANNDGSYSYTYTSDFSKSTESLTDISSSTLCSSLVNYVNEYGVSGKSVNANSKGTVYYNNISVGLYLAVNTKIKDGYNTTSAFLVSVPLSENGEYHYNVNATPKMSISTTTEPVPPEIPVTGVLWWPVPVLAVMGILLVSVGYIKKFKYEKTI